MRQRKINLNQPVNRRITTFAWAVAKLREAHKRRIAKQTKLLKSVVKGMRFLQQKASKIVQEWIGASRTMSTCSIIVTVGSQGCSFQKCSTEAQLKYSQSCKSTWTWSLLWKLLFINWSRVTRVKLSAKRTSHRHRSHCYSMRETTPPSWSTCKSPCCYVMTWLSRN